MRHTLITDYAGLLELVDEWRELLTHFEAPTFFLTPAWLTAWWNTFGEGRQLRAVAFFHNEKLVGLAPLLQRLTWVGSAIPVRRIELLGSGEDEHEEVCSDYLGIVAHPDFSGAIADSLVVLLTQEALGPWDELLLGPTPETDPFHTSLLSRLKGIGFRASLEPKSRSYTVPLPDTWEKYLQALGGRHRYAVVRALRDFAHWAGAEGYRLRRAETPVEVQEGKAILRSLHAERWTAQGSSGVFSSTRFSEFHELLMNDLGAETDGRLDLVWLEANNRPIAVLYNIVHQRRVLFYQSGRTLDLPAHLRPGLVVHALAIQRAIAEGCIEYDFLAGESQYKRQMGLATRELVSLRCHGSSLRSRATHRAIHTARVTMHKLREKNTQLFG